MFFDENLTKTKAFKEQLDQHAEMYATWSEASPCAKDKVLNLICKALISISNWLQTFVSTEFNLKTIGSGFEEIR